MRTLSASCLAVATALFFVATPAQARFGRSDDKGQGNGNHNSNGNGNGNGGGNGGGNHGNGGGNGGGGGSHGNGGGSGGGGGGGTHPATPISNEDGHSNGHGWGHVQHGNGNGYGHEHDATPVTNDDNGNHNGNDNGNGYGNGNDGQTEVVVQHQYDPYVYEPQPAYSSGYYPGYQPVVGYEPSYDNADRVRVFLIGEGTAATNSVTLAGSLRIDGRQYGLVADARALFFSAYPTVDVINVAHAHATYAFLTGPNGRARVELGVAGAFAEQLTAFGPSLGVSADVVLIGGLGVEASAHAVPYPYLSAEYSAGASLAFGAASLHLGWRSIYLDDAGLVDGVSHSDSSTGPYVAFGLTF